MVRELSLEIGIKRDARGLKVPCSTTELPAPFLQQVYQQIPAIPKTTTSPFSSVASLSEEKWLPKDRGSVYRRGRAQVAEVSNLRDRDVLSAGSGAVP